MFAWIATRTGVQLPSPPAVALAKTDLLVNEYVCLTIKSDTKTRAHSQSFRETDKRLDEFRTQCWTRDSFRSWSAMRHRIAFCHCVPDLSHSLQSCGRPFGFARA